MPKAAAHGTAAEVFVGELAGAWKLLEGDGAARQSAWRGGRYFRHGQKAVRGDVLKASLKSLLRAAFGGQGGDGTKFFREISAREEIQLQAS